ncbi:MAG: SLBB domain-containing protein, partial [Armatimonadota bacterium]
MIAPSATLGFRRSVGLLIVLACVSVYADSGEPGQQAPGESGAYRLGVGDTVSVHVLYHADFSVAEATIGPDGRINVPVAGDVIAAGRTAEVVAAEIAAALREELRDPRVSVRLVRRHMEPIYVLGAVRSPGAYEVREAVTVAEAVAMAQGLSSAAAPRWGLVIEGDGETRRIDVLDALQGRGEAGTVRVAPGETLLVSAQFLVTVVGRVAASGRYPVEEGDRVADALASAGGLLDDAGPVGTLVRADGTQRELDIDELIEGGAPGTNIAVLPGDTIVIPQAVRRVALVGAFRQPGKYDFDPGDRVSDALALARDVDEDALAASALLVRADGGSERVDLEALLQAREGARDPELRDGDTLVLPRATDRVAVVGMVADPGPLLLEPGMTVMDAIAAAGGWQEEAQPERTVLWRHAPTGARMTRVNAQKLLRGSATEENPALTAGDIIYVPRDSSMTPDDVA